MDESLPPLYARWMDEFLKAPVPAESRSTCHDCPMISEDAARNTSGFRFDPHTKCCTYWPEIPNFLAGLILNDPDPAFAKARAKMESLMMNGVTLTPLGASPPPSFFVQYKNETSFGTNPSLLCPFYQQDQTGNCGIWKYRNSRCATWFCRFTRGSVSVIFWKYMDQLLTLVERGVSRWCLLQLGIAGSALQQLFPPPRSQTQLTPEIWGEWLGREREFFIECAKLSSSLTWSDVSKIGGTELELSARLLKESWENLNRGNLPLRLKINQWKKSVPAGDGNVRIWTYSRYDPVLIPRSVVEALTSFQNCTTQEALKRIEHERGIRLDSNFVQWLVDFGVLTVG